MSAPIYSQPLSSVYWLPIEFNIVGEEFSTTYTPILFSNGMTFNLHDCLKDYNDISFNRRTGMFLTNIYNYNSILKNNTAPQFIDNLTEIKSPLATLNSLIISLSTNLNGSNGLFRTNKLEVTSEDNLTFTFNSDNKVIIEAPDKTVLTGYSTDPNGLSFQLKISPPDSRQLFDYILGPDTIILFKSETGFSQIVTRTNNTFQLSSINFSLDTVLPEICILKLASYTGQSDLQTDIKNSTLIRYLTNPLSDQKSLKVNPNILTTGYAQNYLGVYPYEYPQIKDHTAVYDLQIHGLKNYQTPEYNYSFGREYVPGQTGIRRLYDRIFTGTNQEKGLNNVYLGFQSNTSQIIFKRDQDTPFYFPPSTKRTALSSAGIIEDGGVASGSPYTSDRIYIKQIDYTEKTPGIPQPPSVTRYSNVWLCSWLSGDNNGNAAWMDRFYNSAYYTIDQALSAKSLFYHHKITADKEFTFDVPSTMVLEPGILYRYHRVGPNVSSSFVTHLDADPRNPLGSKVLHISAWNSSPLQDLSKHNNDGLIFFNNAQNLKDQYWILDGTNHAVFPAKTSLLESTRMTVSLWINVDDWANINGSQIFGNYYDSGFGLVNDSALTAPLFSLVNNISSTSYDINYRLNVVNSNDIPKLPLSNNNIVLRLPDFSTWVFDTHNIIGRKFNTYGHIDYTTSPSLSAFLYNIDQVEVDGNGNLFVYDATNYKLVKTDSNGNYITNYSLVSSAKRFELDLTNTVVPIYGQASVIDNLNNIWESIGSNLYKNRVIYANIGPIQQLTCDASNNIWILHDQDSVTKLNADTGEFSFNFRIGENSDLAINPCNKPATQTRFLNFLRTPNLNQTLCSSVKSTTEDLAVLIDNDNDQVYLLDVNGNLLTKLNLNTLSNGDSSDFEAKGDYSGYQYLRKYNSSTKNLSWKFKISNPDGTGDQYFSLNYGVSSLPNGWHNFAFVFDSTKGYAQYYIDSLVVDQINFTPNKYQLYYDYRSSLLLGAASVKNSTLNDIIGIDDAYKFIGKVADLRMYNKSLSLGEIEQIYFAAPFNEGREDLAWNTSVGNCNFIEEIQHWFQMQLPGSKSKYYNINIHNLNVSDEIKKLIENALKNNIQKISPAQASLYKINWM
jgi:hypothetical protein